MSAQLAPRRPPFAGSYGLPIRQHAARLRACGYSLPAVTEYLRDYYGVPIHLNVVTNWLQHVEANAPQHGRGSYASARYDGCRSRDITEQWLCKHDPEYAQSRKLWQSPRTDALTRNRARAELGSDELERRLWRHALGAWHTKPRPSSDSA